MKGKQMALAAAVVMLGGLPLLGDVIYLKSGNVLVVEKAWQEGDQVKYQTTSGLQTIPLASVKRLQGQKPAAADPSRNQAVQAVVIRGQGTPASPPLPSKLLQNRSQMIPEPAPALLDTRMPPVTRKPCASRKRPASLWRSISMPIGANTVPNWNGEFSARSEVKQYLETILYVCVNPEHGNAEAALFEKFEGRGYPTFLILAKNQPAQEIPTSVRPEVFLQECREAAQGGN